MAAGLRELQKNQWVSELWIGKQEFSARRGGRRCALRPGERPAIMQAWKKDKNMDRVEIINAFYSEYPEDDRLSRSRPGQLEYRTAMHYIRRLLPRNARVLETGAGTGRISPCRRRSLKRTSDITCASARRRSCWVFPAICRIWAGKHPYKTKRRTRRCAPVRNVVGVRLEPALPGRWVAAPPLPRFQRPAKGREACNSRREIGIPYI